MEYLAPLVLILGSILAMSGIIIAKKPDAKRLIDALAPFQAIIGVGMIGCGLWWLVKWLGVLTDMFRLNGIYAASVMVIIADSVILGVMFGLPIIASWMPHNSPATAKMQNLVQQVLPFQVLLGLAGAAASIVFILFQTGILSMTGILG